MIKLAKKENKFLALVIPEKDVEPFFNKYPYLQEIFEIIGEAYYGFRRDIGKNPSNKYIIVNKDEPYIEEVWDMILKGEDKKANSQSNENKKEDD